MNCARLCAARCARASEFRSIPASQHALGRQAPQHGPSIFITHTSLVLRRMTVETKICDEFLS